MSFQTTPKNRYADWERGTPATFVDALARLEAGDKAITLVERKSDGARFIRVASPQLFYPADFEGRRRPRDGADYTESRVDSRQDPEMRKHLGAVWHDKLFKEHASKVLRIE
jgi:hypothetical protein